MLFFAPNTNQNINNAQNFNSLSLVCNPMLNFLNKLTTAGKYKSNNCGYYFY